MRESWDEIVAAISGQDEQDARSAFTQVVGMLEPKLLAYLIRHRGVQPCDADESVQRTWLKVWMLRALADRARYFRSWVFRIAQNEAADVHRRNRRQVQWSDENPDIDRAQQRLCGMDEQETDPAGRPSAPGDAMPGTDELRGRGLLHRLRAAIGTLPADDRTILDAWSRGTADQWITAELLERLGLARKSLRVRLHRVKKKLQNLVRQVEQEARNLPTQDDASPQPS